MNNFLIFSSAIGWGHVFFYSNNLFSLTLFQGVLTIGRLKSASLVEKTYTMYDTYNSNYEEFDTLTYSWIMTISYEYISSMLKKTDA